MQRLAEGVLTQIASLLNVECAGILVLREEGDQARSSRCSPAPAATASSSAGARPRPSSRNCASSSRRPSSAGVHDFHSERSVLYIGTGSGREVVVLLEAGKSLSETDRALVEVFCSRLSAAFDNVILYEQLQQANAGLEERVAEPHRAS